MLLIRLSGHSGAGKSRLLAELSNRNVQHRKTVLYTSRPPRDGEIHGKDYYFLSRKEIERLPSDAFFIGQVREMLQAVDLKQLEYGLRSGDIVIIEIFHTLWPGVERIIKSRMQDVLSTTSVFLTAIDPGSIRNVSTDVAAGIIKHEIRRILEWRSKDPIDSIVRRSESAVEEILNALRGLGGYDKILHSAPEGPDGQDDWTRGDVPEGQAAHTVEEFLSFIREKCESS